MLISIISRETVNSTWPVNTLTISDGETRVSLNISDKKKYQLIAQHELTQYEVNDQEEEIWDNKPVSDPAPAATDERNEADTSGEIVP